jgi:hypothetical protein
VNVAPQETLRLPLSAHQREMLVPANAKEKFYGPLKQVAAQYVPLLMARMKVLQGRANHALDFLDAEEDDDREVVWMDEPERIVAVAEAQSVLHKSVLEAGMCQSLIGAFADLLENDYQKIKEGRCFFLNEEGEFESLYEDDESNGDLPWSNG